MTKFLVFAAIAAAFMLTATAIIKTDVTNCGKLKISQVYNESRSAASDEFPWFGRIFFKAVDFDAAVFLCLGVLVSQQHMISPARCHVLRYELMFVILGEPDADNIRRTVADVAIHPRYNSPRRAHDVAVMLLHEPVKLSAFIQPICLPPPSTYNDNFLGQYLTYGGYDTTTKMKAVAHVMQPAFCSAVFNASALSRSRICVTTTSTFNTISGSAVMGLNVEGDELRSYYLIALKSSSSVALGATIVEEHMKISSQINWINSNINVKRGAI